MIVTTMNKDRLFSLSLPEKVAGQYWLHPDEGGQSRHSIGVEGVNGEWILKSNRYVKILEKEGSVKTRTLVPMSVTPLENELSERMIVFVEPDTQDRFTFQKYLVTKNMEMTIGRGADNDICISYY